MTKIDNICPGVAIIILNWNGLDDTIECLESLKKIAYPNYQVIVLDNGSKGGDANILEEKYKNDIKLLRSEKNNLFAKGNNIALRYLYKSSKPEYILLLNNDTVVHPHFLNEMVEVAESDSKIGIVGSTMYFFDHHGKSDKVWFYGGRINWKKYPGYFQDLSYLKYASYTKFVCDWITGAALLFKAHLFDYQIFLNEKFPFGCEDIDLCLAHDVKIVLATKSKIWHKAGVSRKKRPLFSILNNISSNFRLAKKYNKNFLKIWIIYAFFLFK
jgi:GT2 family glycosyltransferase